MKIRISNDSGIGYETKITNAETGELLSMHIRQANIHCSIDEIITAELTFNIPRFDIFAIAKLSEKTKQDLKELKNILEKIEKLE